MLKKIHLVLFAFCALCAGGATYAVQPLPVLPYPQQVFFSDDPVALDASAPPTLVLLGKDPAADALIRATAPDCAKIGSEGYVLIINSRERIIAANTQTGLFYGQQTLNQLTRARYDRAITITDWPDFPLRVIYDDISRGPIPTVDYIKKQIDRMAELKINALSFYIEHVVQPLSHPDFAPPDGKLTIAQIKELSAYAAARHMQLIGSFQSFGHFEKILALPQYKHMGETNTLISPLDPDAKKFLASVIGELCDAFNSPYFNVNCDETFDLTKGRSKEYIDKVGPAKFYADHLKFLYDIVKSRGKRMMLWGDVALQYEEIMDLLPRDVIYLTWEYGPKDNFDKWLKPFSTRGLEFMVCPGILNSYRMFPDMVMAKGNISGFLREGKQNGATGAFTTIWDDGGTYLFAADWYGVYVAAEKSWNTENAPDATFDRRYESAAYDNDGAGYYTKALFKLMELRGVDLTYNLNDQLWHHKILPDYNKQLIINNASAPQAKRILDEAREYMGKAAAARNQDDLKALEFGINQYEIIMDTRLEIARVVNAYAEATALAPSDSAKAENILRAQIAALGKLKVRYVELQGSFRDAWFSENQNYWFDKVIAPYVQKQNDLSQLHEKLTAALAGLKNTRSLPDASALRLNITLSDRFYFKNWMLGGAFPLAADNTIPGFLYSENKEYDKPPSPGDFTHWLGKTYRWQKYSSTDGGIVDLDANYKTPASAAAYAYCLINTAKPLTAAGWLSASDDAEVFCNGVKVYAGGGGGGFPGEQALSLPLKSGVNHVLIKLRKANARPWIFTFRLQDDLALTNHKHKYTLNAKIKEFDAE